MFQHKLWIRFLSSTGMDVPEMVLKSPFLLLIYIHGCFTDSRSLELNCKHEYYFCIKSH